MYLISTISVFSHNPCRIISEEGADIKGLTRVAGLSLAAVLAAAGGAAESPRPWFSDATRESGIPPVKTGEGACLLDLDGDGLPELFLPSVQGRNRLFANRGGFRFEDVTGARGGGEAGGIGAVFGDFDGDGKVDLYVVRTVYPHGGNVLYRQETDNVFRAEPQDGDAVGRKNGIAAVVGDADGDGRPDLFVANWTRSSTRSARKTSRQSWPQTFGGSANSRDESTVLTYPSLVRGS